MSTTAPAYSRLEESTQRMSHPALRPNRLAFVLLALVASLSAGCGTTRWTNTGRTATEQLLISDAVDQAVQSIDFTPISGEKVFFDGKSLKGAVDQAYVEGSLRQHLLASGCTLMEKREEADYIVEARAGAIGTDQHDVLYGIPATTVPSMVPLPGIPSQIPEIPFAKRTNQIGVAKLAVFAFERETGNSVWQSGIASQTSRAKDIWLLGAGPFQKGTIYSGTAFAGQTISNPLNPWNAIARDKDRKGVPITASAVFLHDKKVAKATSEPTKVAKAKDETAPKPTVVAEKPPAKAKESPAVATRPPQDDTPRVSLLPPVLPESIQPEWPTTQGNGVVPAIPDNSRFVK